MPAYSLVTKGTCEIPAMGSAPHSQEELSPEPQINVAPTRHGGLWKVISSAVRCPICQSTDTKALTGKRRNGQGLLEQYRRCCDCEMRFRLVLE